ncbi:hypothetical protein ATKI12_8325 [Kitasatospora sp. Ki12]
MPPGRRTAAKARRGPPTALFRAAAGSRIPGISAPPGAGRGRRVNRPAPPTGRRIQGVRSGGSHGLGGSSR